MHENNGVTQAFFLFSNRQLIAADLVCSGKLETQFKGPCKYSDNGKMPGLIRLVFDGDTQASRLGRNGDFAPPCALEQLGRLGTWQLTIGERYPHRYWDLRVYKCRQMLMLIVPGIRDDRAYILSDD